MSTPYGTFIHEHYEGCFTVFVTIPAGVLEVARFVGTDALKRGAKFYEECTGTPIDLATN